MPERRRSTRRKMRASPPIRKRRAERKVLPPIKITAIKQRKIAKVRGLFIRAEKLPAQERGRVIKQIMGFCKGHSTPVRSMAIISLGKLKAREATSLIQELTESTNLEIRQNAEWALAKIQGKKVRRLPQIKEAVGL